MKFSYLSILLLILLPILMFFLIRGMVIHDEGYILHSSEKLLFGQFPYRDFGFVYTPGSLFLTAFSFLLFGSSILTSRILMTIISLVSCFLIFKIVQLTTKNKFYSTLGVLIFVSWGPTHINFAWPIMFVIPITLLTCYLLLKFLETRNNLFLFFSGIAAFAVFVFKQNFGIAILFPLIAFFITKNVRQIHYLLRYIYGYIWGIIGFIIYLLITDSFSPFVRILYYYTFQRIIINNLLTSSFIYHDESLLKTTLRITFYLIPAILAVGTFIILFIRRRFHLLFIPLLILSIYIFGIIPTTDYVHLSPLLSIIGVNVALFLRYNIHSTLRYIVILLSIFLILLGFQTALYKDYYGGDSALILNNNFNSNRKISIFLHDKFNSEISEITNIIDRTTETNDYIFVNSYNPMIYFISNRQNPMINGFLETQVDKIVYYEKVLGNLIAKKIKVLILDHNNLSQLSIKNYIEKNYYLVKVIGDFDIYLRRN